MIRFNKQIITAAFLTLLTASAFCQNIDEQARVMQLTLLQDHMISTTPQNLVEFLKKGFPENIDWTTLPPHPRDKSEIYLYAIEELGRTREKSAFNIISILAQGESVPGLDRIIEHDLASMRPAEPVKREIVLRGAVQYNSIIALGLLGDQQAVPVLLKLYPEQIDDRWRVQVIIALASLGDTTYMDDLVEIVKLENQVSSVQAHEALFLITGKDWGYSATCSIKMRDKLANEVALWWLGNKNTFTPEPREIIRRRYFAPEPVRPVPRNLRDLLDAASHYPDPQKRYHANYARSALERIGDTRIDEMRQVAMDEWEDLMVRREAIRRIYDLQGKKSKSFLKKLRKDENPEVSSLAKHLLERMKEEY